MTIPPKNLGGIVDIKLLNSVLTCCIICKVHKKCAGVMELVDVVDSKSTAVTGVPVRVRPPAPTEPQRVTFGALYFHIDSRYVYGLA